MKKKRRMRKIKSFLKNTILVLITQIAFLMFVASAEALVEHTVKALLVFILSLAWLVVFAHANQ